MLVLDLQPLCAHMHLPHPLTELKIDRSVWQSSRGADLPRGAAEVGEGPH